MYANNWQSEVFMSVHLPGWLRNPYSRLPIQLYIHFGVVWVIFVGWLGLFIVALQGISIVYLPYAISVWFIIFKLSLIEGSIGEYPFALNDFILIPLAHQFHSCGSIGVSSLPFLLAELPPARVSILILILIGSFAMLNTVFPLPYIIRSIP